MIPPTMNTQFTFAIIFFNSSQSKLYDMDGWKQRPPPAPHPIFYQDSSFIFLHQLSIKRGEAGFGGHCFFLICFSLKKFCCESNRLSLNFQCFFGNQNVVRTNNVHQARGLPGNVLSRKVLSTLTSLHIQLTESL